jgi:hypothetical protein
MTSKEHTLLTEAAEQFPDLTDAEQKLLHAVIHGEVADYSSPNDPENDPQHADTWDALRTIRAKVIHWLCVDREATRQIDPHSINILAATIEGRLDLAYVTIPVPLVLTRCAVKAGVTLAYADTRTLAFSGSVLSTSDATLLNAMWTQVRGDVLLDRGFGVEEPELLLGQVVKRDVQQSGYGWSAVRTTSAGCIRASGSRRLHERPGSGRSTPQRWRRA